MTRKWGEKRSRAATAFFLALILLITMNGTFWMPRIEAATSYSWEKFNVISKPQYKIEQDWTKYYSQSSQYTYITGYSSYTFDKNTGNFSVSGNPVSYSNAGALTWWSDGQGTTGYAGSTVTYQIGNYNTLVKLSNYHEQASGNQNYTNFGNKQEVYKSVSDTPLQTKGASLGFVNSATKSYPENAIHTDGYWYVYKGQNTAPTMLTPKVTASPVLSNLPDHNKMKITARFSDPDLSDTLKITLTPNIGPSKTMIATQSGTEHSAIFIFSPTDFSASGEITSLKYEADDGSGGTYSESLGIKIRVDLTPLVYYDKYKVVMGTRYEEGEFGSQNTSYGGFGTWTTSYSFDPVTGNYYPAGNTLPDMKTYWSYFASGKTLYQMVGYRQTLGVWDYYYRSASAVGYPQQMKGTLVTPNIIELDKTYPDNGIHTDGFWYVKKTTANSFPTTTIDSQPDVILTKDTKLTVSGRVTDLDNENVKIQATVGGVLKQTTVSDTKNGAAWNLSWDEEELPEGIYTGIQIIASDPLGGSNSYPYTGTITVDKNAPVISITPNSVKWGKDDVALQVHYSDTVGLELSSLQYKITHSVAEPDEWDSAIPLQELKIKDEGVWYVHAYAKDQAGHETYRVSQAIQIDSTNPTIEITAEQETWQSEPVSVKIVYADAGSGIDPNERKYKITGRPDAPSVWDTASADEVNIVIEDEGEWYVHAKAQDLAGNAVQISTHPIRHQNKPTIPELTLQEAGKDFVSLYWSLPETSFTSGYEYEVRNLTTGQTASPILPEHRWTEEGLEPGTEYRYTVKVRNHVGESVSKELTALTLPAQPAELKVESISHDSAHANVSFDGVQSAQSYEIVAKVAETQEVAFSDTVKDAGTYKLNNLKPGKPYSVSVNAVNATGRGEAATIGFLSLPAAPGEFNLLQIQADSVKIGWEAAETASSYELGRDDQTIYAGDQLMFTDEELESATTYDYQVAAKNETGFGDIAYLLDVLTLPAATVLTIQDVASDSTTLSWLPVDGADHYVVLLDGKEHDSVDGETERVVLTGLSAGVSYEVEVFAVNASGAGTGGKAAILTLPAAASDLEAGSITETSVRLQWQPVNGADQYKVTIDGQMYNVSGTSLDIASLIGGTEYRWTVAAGNASGYGATSEENVFLTLPAAPDGIKVEKVTTSSVVLSLPAVQSATSYIVTYDGEEMETEELPIEISGLQSGSTYPLLVSAVNETGQSAVTPYEVTTLPTVVDSERIKLGDVGQDSAEVSWEPVNGAEEYVIRNGEQEWVAQTPPLILDHLESGKIYDSITITPVGKGGEGESTQIPAFETLPTKSFTANAVGGDRKIEYQVDVQSLNETVVAAAKGKEFYRGKKRSFSLDNVSAGETVLAEVWLENSLGDRSEVKKVSASALPAPPAAIEDSIGNSDSGGDLNTPKDTEKDKDKDKDNETITPDVDEVGSQDGKYFADIKSLYNRDQVMKLNEMGIVKGVGQDQFDPYRSITRAEFAALIVRALELTEDSAKSMSFVDVQQGDWYYDPLKAASDHQVIDGFSATRFGPKETVTREQAAKMLANAIEAKQPSVVTFTDESLIAPWAEGEVKALAGMRIITGYPDGTFKPKNLLNRAESVSLIYNTLGLNIK